MKIKVMTFNLRYRNEADGVNIFDNRLPRIVQTIKDENPDIIGFQEVTSFMKNAVATQIMDAYVVIGCGRGRDYRGESVCIAYRRELFELVEFETFWLSDTPTVAGSRYENADQSACPRFTLRALLSPEGYDGCISFYNTHLDHKGNLVRVTEMKQVAEKINGVGGKFILTGDMNDYPDSECIGVVAKMDGIVDATADIPYTFHNFGRSKNPPKIDYIFTNAKALGGYAVEDVPVNGIYISDHYPVCAEIEI